MTDGNALSELSHIPADWKWFKLRELASIYTGMTPPTNNNNYYGHEFMFVSPADLGGRKYINSTKKHLSRLGMSVARKFPPNSILFTCIGSTIGKCGIAKTTLTSNQQINCVFAHDRIDTEYLYYQLLSASQRIRAAASEQAVPMINKTDFGAQEVCVPDAISEQKAIAKALSDTDALITALEKLIEKKRAIKTATMQQLLTGRTRLPAFGEGKGYKDSELGRIPEDWDVVPLETLVSYLGSGRSSNRSLATAATRYKLYGSTGVIGWQSTPDYEGEAILVARVGANAGRTSLVKGEYGVSDNTLIVRIKKDLSTLFFYYLLTYKDLNQLVFGSGQPLITGGQLKGIRVVCPRENEQAAISNVISIADDQISNESRRLKKLRSIKTAMMQQLLTGRTRLV